MRFFSLQLLSNSFLFIFDLPFYYLELSFDSGSFKKSYLLVNLEISVT